MCHYKINIKLKRKKKCLSMCPWYVFVCFWCPMCVCGIRFNCNHCRNQIVIQFNECFLGECFEARQMSLTIYKFKIIPYTVYKCMHTYKLIIKHSYSSIQVAHHALPISYHRHHRLADDIFIFISKVN